MATRPSIFAFVLRDCRQVQGLSLREMARQMIGHGFPSYRHSGQPPGSGNDIAWLADLLDRIENATLYDAWPLIDDTDLFLDAAAGSLRRVPDASMQLRAAMIIDVLRSLDPLSLDPS